MEIDEQESAKAGKRGRVFKGEEEQPSKKGKEKDSIHSTHILPIPPEQLWKTEPKHPMFYTWEKRDESTLSEDQKVKLERGKQLREEMKAADAQEIFQKMRDTNEARFMAMVQKAHQQYEEDLKRGAEEAAKCVDN